MWEGRGMGGFGIRAGRDGRIWEGREGWRDFGEMVRDGEIGGGSKGSPMLEGGTVGRGN